MLRIDGLKQTIEVENLRKHAAVFITRVITESEALIPRLRSLPRTLEDLVNSEGPAG